MSVYKAINAVQKSLSKTGISKDRTNTQGAGYKFRGIDDVYNALAPLLAEHGLCILPRMLERACEERQSKSGGALFYVTVKAEFDFVCAEDGSKHTVSTFGEAMDSGDKATNKAMSAAYKYAAFQAFAIPTEGDNDADSQTHEVNRDPWAIFKPAESARIRMVGQACIDYFNAGKEWGAWEEYSTLLDKAKDNDFRNNVILALWDMWKPHSALRAYIKKAEADLKNAEPTNTN